MIDKMSWQFLSIAALQADKKMKNPGLSSMANGSNLRGLRIKINDSVVML